MPLSDLAPAVIPAFRGAPRPAPENIAPHPCEECLEVSRYLEGRDPLAFTEDDVRGCVWDLPLLSAEAKRFYLPVWLLSSMADPDQTDATDALVYALDGDHRWDPRGRLHRGAARGDRALPGGAGGAPV